jgi:hypothetical protein
MNRTVLASLAVAVPLAIGIAVSLSGRNVTASSGAPPAMMGAAAAPATREQLVARGEHLVTTSGCHDCHTPLKMGANGPEPDMSRMLSGHPDAMKLPPVPKPEGPWLVAVSASNTAWSGPWGVSYTANLTPDKETGLGAWDKDTFVRAIKTGRHMGAGRPILPPMPIPAYKNFTEEELGAMFTYLQTIPAIKNRVPDPVLGAGPNG